MQRQVIQFDSLVGTVLLLAIIGCGQPPVDTGPSYAELVVTYNAELEALDRLESKREKLTAEYAAALNPPASDDALSQLEGLLQSARGLQTDVDPTTADPNALLDQLAGRTESAEDIAGQLVDGLLGGQSNEFGAEGSVVEPSAEQAKVLDELKAKYEPQIAALDKEIAEQRLRVDRARAARDAAEAETKQP